jgi:hypothetical protein
MRKVSMSLKMGINGGRREAGRRWREMFRRRQEMHDPMLVFNMSIFNFGEGWDRIFNPFKTQSRY